ncbi:hypothetical protein GEOBRER4_n2240 [Citrifermentans bremense]|uniref:Uncharacterized protein n=1 Tax=Citrifermentans bremense TaxID=60035 RepID=A0A6S6M1B0_9BACT|nr:hypothetical protein [Citrifermentans bremense]BCG47408.1 hypothetical protein GEOBRER4_n2240 [Citrifermentans bremense]
MDKEKLPEQGSEVAEAPVDAVEAVIDSAVISAGLSKIRRRRWMVWSVMIIYLPTMWTTQKITHSFNASMPVFFIWFLLLLAAMGYSAVARCPRCGNYYHVNGMILLYLRKCLHCQLPLNEDKSRPQF